jgi:hypothetical protein
MREVCSEFPGRPAAIHRSIPYPSREGGMSRESCPAFERTAEELEARIPYLLDLSPRRQQQRR